MRKIKFSFALLLYLAGGAARAQKPKSVPPPPKSADNGPSLEVTMKFIQDKINGQDNVGFVHTTSSMAGATFRTHEGISDVLADPATCTLHITRTTREDIELENGVNYTEGGNPVTGDDLQRRTVWTVTLSLKDIGKIMVESLQDAYNRSAAQQAHPEIISMVTPSVFALDLFAEKSPFSFHYARTVGKNAPQEGFLPQKEANYVFVDEETANRVAKAMLHAVELCGGGNKDPF